VSVRKVERVRQRCTLEDSSAALNPKKRPSREPKVDGEAEARLIQLACSEPPSGRQRFPLRLLADKRVVVMDNQKLKARSRELRSSMIDAEISLWAKLRRKHLHGQPILPAKTAR
jgi:hypothetical protein